MTVVVQLDWDHMNSIPMHAWACLLGGGRNYYGLPHGPADHDLPTGAARQEGPSGARIEPGFLHGSGHGKATKDHGEDDDDPTDGDQGSVDGVY